MPPRTLHIGRSWTGHEIEDECPCPQTVCGLIDVTQTVPECEHHPVDRAQSVRQGHYSDECPGHC